MAENTTGVQQAVERALSEALVSIERQLGEVQNSFEQVKGALEAAAHQSAAERFVDLLPPLMQMQAAGAALAASIETVLRFIGVSAQWTGVPAIAAPAVAPAAPAPEAEEPAEEEAVPPITAEAPPLVEEVAVEPEAAAPPESVSRLDSGQAEPAPVESEEQPAVEVAPAPAALVDIESLPNELKQLHKKAKRFAKVAVQELLMYKQDEVAQGRQNKELYQRFKDEIDKSKALYDKRFAKIASHNIDYLYDELIRVLAENDPSALGDYPYSPPAAHLR